MSYEEEARYAAIARIRSERFFEMNARPLHSQSHVRKVCPYHTFRDRTLSTRLWSGSREDEADIVARTAESNQASSEATMKLVNIPSS
jgi:hypothetical protein